MAKKPKKPIVQQTDETWAAVIRARNYRARKRRELAVNNAILDALGAAINRAYKHNSIHKFLSDLRQTSASSIEEAGIEAGKDVYNARLKLQRLAQGNEGQ